MDMGCNTTKQTIEQLSEQVKSGVRELRTLMEEFYEPAMTAPAQKDCSVPPQLSALKQIEDNLTLTNQMIKTAVDLFHKIKNQIR